MKTITAFLAIIAASAFLYAANPPKPPKAVQPGDKKADHPDDQKVVCPDGQKAVCPGEQKIQKFPLSLYKQSYLVLGNMDDQVKAQFSFKFDPFYSLIDNLGLYLAYTQLMDWRFYDKSSPFRDINFNPEVFLRLESQKNVFRNVDLGPLDYLQLGFFEHKSNGKEGADSRSWNRGYVQFQLSVGSTLNFGVNIKYFLMYLKMIEEQNRDIQRYIGSWETTVFFRHMKNGKLGLFELYVRFGAGGGPGGFNFYKGWQEWGIIFPSPLQHVRPYLQMFHGYGEYLLGYNKQRTDTWGGTFLHGTGIAIRIGLTME